jgi:hypothetical protein
VGCGSCSLVAPYILAAFTLGEGPDRLYDSSSATFVHERKHEEMGLVGNRARDRGARFLLVVRFSASDLPIRMMRWLTLFTSTFGRGTTNKGAHHAPNLPPWASAARKGKRAAIQVGGCGPLHCEVVLCYLLFYATSGGPSIGFSPEATFRTYSCQHVFNIERSGSAAES